MEDRESGTINVRIPSDKVEELQRLCRLFGVSKSQLVKFAFQHFLDMVENTPPSSYESMAKNILSVSDKMKKPRPKRYRTKNTRSVMLVAEEPDNSWGTPKKKDEKKKKRNEKNGDGVNKLTPEKGNGSSPQEK